MTTKIVNIYDKDKSKREYDVYIGRAGQGKNGYFGNPFLLGLDGSREEVIEKYKTYFFKRIAEDIVFRLDVLTLKGKKLGCFCHPLACHGDVIAKHLDGS